MSLLKSCASLVRLFMILGAVHLLLIAAHSTFVAAQGCSRRWVVSRQGQSSNACARRIRSRWQQWRSLVRSHTSFAHLVHVNVVSHVMARIVFEHCEHRCVWPTASLLTAPYVCVLAGFMLLAACLVTAGGLCLHCRPGQHRYAPPWRRRCLVPQDRSGRRRVGGGRGRG